MAWMLQLPAYRIQMTNSTSPMATQYLDLINDIELGKDGKRRQVEEAVVQRLAENEYQVLLKFAGDNYFRAMATRRAPDEPRLFRNLERVLTHIAQNYRKLREVTIEQLAPEVVIENLWKYRQG